MQSFYLTCDIPCQPITIIIVLSHRNKHRCDIIRCECVRPCMRAGGGVPVRACMRPCVRTCLCHSTWSGVHRWALEVSCTFLAELFYSDHNVAYKVYATHSLQLRQLVVLLKLACILSTFQIWMNVSVCPAWTVERALTMRMSTRAIALACSAGQTVKRVSGNHCLNATITNWSNCISSVPINMQWPSLYTLRLLLA